MNESKIDTTKKNLLKKQMWLSAVSEETVLSCIAVAEKDTGDVLMYRIENNDEWYNPDDFDTRFFDSRSEAALDLDERKKKLQAQIVAAKDFNQKIFEYDLAEPSEYMPKWVAEAYDEHQHGFRTRIKKAFHYGFIILNSKTKKDANGNGTQTRVPTSEISTVDFNPCVITTKAGIRIPVDNPKDIDFLDYLYGEDTFDF